MSALLRFFPPVVTGTIIAVIGISLMRVGVNWAAGAAAPNLPGYGDPVNLLVAAFVLIVILLHHEIRKRLCRQYRGVVGHYPGIYRCLADWKVNFTAFNNAALAGHHLSLSTRHAEV